MHEWMSANPRPERPQFDGQAYHALEGQGSMMDYRQDFRSQLGDWRGDMRDWRGERKDWRHGMMGPNMQFPLNPAQGLPTGEAPQQIPGSSYGFNLGQILSQFPNGLRGLRNSQPGL